MLIEEAQLAKLQSAEELEKGAAGERVAYYRSYLSKGDGDFRRLLDLGCGNGYAVDAWRSLGVCAVGIDVSMYRFSRWLSEPREVRPFVVADARRLPFGKGVFAAVISSGMLEHVGVAESRPPYRAQALPERESERSRVVQEALRVLDSEGAFYLDFPNGAFPVDFWHGDDAGSFRIHPTPDALLPTYSDLVSWFPEPTPELFLLPIRKRLRFRQIASRWWGHAFRLPMQVFLKVLDSTPRSAFVGLLVRLYPFIAVRIRPRSASEYAVLRRRAGPLAGL